MSHEVIIIGSGMIARRHLEALASLQGKAHASIVHGRNPEATAALAKEFDLPWTTNQEQALRSGDIAAICTPTGTHSELGDVCLRAGLHTLVEKPLEVQMQRAKVLLDATHTTGRLLGCVFQLRTLSSYHSLFSAITRGDLGNIELITLTIPWYRPQQYYDSARWRGTGSLDGGVLFNQGSHYLDIVLQVARLVGARRVCVQAAARTSSIHSVEVDTIATVILDFHPGPLAVFAATTMANPGRPVDLTVCGTQQSVQIVGDELRSDALRAIDGVLPQHAWAMQAHAAVYRDFVHAIDTGSRLMVTAEEAMSVVAVAEAAQKQCVTKEQQEVDIL
jgi:predicted dehydrogenase